MVSPRRFCFFTEVTVTLLMLKETTVGASVLGKGPGKESPITCSSAHMHRDPFQGNAEYNPGSGGQRARLPQLKGKLVTQW